MTAAATTWKENLVGLFEHQLEARNHALDAIIALEHEDPDKALARLWLAVDELESLLDLVDERD